MAVGERVLLLQGWGGVCADEFKAACALAASDFRTVCYKLWFNEFECFNKLATQIGL